MQDYFLVFAGCVTISFSRKGRKEKHQVRKAQMSVNQHFASFAITLRSDSYRDLCEALF